MKNAKHTPGPWTIQPFDRKDGSGIAICHEGTKPIAWLYQFSPNAFNEMRPIPLDQTANARLLSAAPDAIPLFEELQEYLCEHGDAAVELLSRIDEWLTKVKGD